MSVSMVRGGDFFAKGYGHARLDPPLNWTSQTPAYLGSVGKAITSALLGILMTETRNTANRFIAMLPPPPHEKKTKQNKNKNENNHKSEPCIGNAVLICLFSIATLV